MAELNISHNAGFFSCCSVRLNDIINFFNKHRRLPYSVDSSRQFLDYKSNGEDICQILFDDPSLLPSIDYVKDIEYSHEFQFQDYKQLNFDDLNPFIVKYFSVTDLVKDKVSYLEKKYGIDYNNTVSVFYRGNDKARETGIAPYEKFINTCIKLYSIDNTLRFFVQTDELEFRDHFVSVFPNSFFIEEMPVISKNPNLVIHKLINKDFKQLFALNFLASTIIVSRCKYIVTHTGNCGLWACLFKGNSDNIHQYIKHPKV